MLGSLRDKGVALANVTLHVGAGTFQPVRGDDVAAHVMHSEWYSIPQETVDAINKRRAEKQGSARAEYMKLDEMGILGVTHMMMLDSNSNQIADLMLDCAKKYVPAARKR